MIVSGKPVARADTAMTSPRVARTGQMLNISDRNINGGYVFNEVSAVELKIRKIIGREDGD
jgi:hypothetical protein